jgi:hypothetical protein
VKARDVVGTLAAVNPAAGMQPDIRDIRGPITIPTLWPWLLLAAGAVTLFLALGAATYWLVRRLRRGRVKSAAELALERLERARRLARSGNAAELSAEASDAVRQYIETRFALRAAHRTTEEFLHDLLDGGPSPIAPHRQPLAEFLGACDLAKFARFEISVERMGAMIDTAQAFVRATSAPPAAESGQPSTALAATQEVRP